MKRHLAALACALALLAYAAAAQAACTTYTVNGVLCTQCCWNGNCTLTCI